jgi:carbonic anhydrase
MHYDCTVLCIQVAQLHVHWGSKDTDGSEHLLDGKQYVFETHLVTSYGSDGKYAVVNRFFKVVSILQLLNYLQLYRISSQLY